MKTSEQLDKIAPALLAAQKAIKWAAKDSTNPHYKSAYADLQSVIEAVKPALNSNGITFLQSHSPGRDGQSGPPTLYLTTRLLHESGQWVEDTAACPLPKADPQGYGSASTYSRRYSLGAICGLFSSDDDGEAAAVHPITKAQLATLGKLAEAQTERVKKALDYYKVASCNELNSHQAESIINKLT